MNKDEIRPIYTELRGYLLEAPSTSKGNRFYDEEAFWNQYHETIERLSEITEEDYSRYKIPVQSAPYNGRTRKYIDILTYRSKLSGLITFIYGKYFSEEASPLDGMPSTIIHQNQNQNQTVNILLEIQSKIDSKLPNLPEGNEKSFLKKVKEALGSVSSVSQLITLIAKTAKDLGITTEQIYQLFI